MAISVKPWLKKLVIAASAVTALSAVPAYAVICSEDANIAIPDNTGSASITIDLPPSPGTTVTDLDFQLAIDHTWVGDLIVTLTSPSGTTVTLLDRPGTPPGNFGCNGDNIETTFDDASGTEAEDQCANADPTIGGTHQPTGSLADFNGELVSGTWTLNVSDNARRDVGTIISNENCIDVSTTPVTISSFESQSRGRFLKAKWETSSESFNLGFHLWGNVSGEWQQLNRALIASRVVDSVVPQNYRHKVDLLKLDGELTQIGISSVSTSGQEEFYGPFDIGEKYGEEAVPEYVDWAYQRALHDEAMLEAGYVKRKHRWVRNNKWRQRIQRRQEQRFADVLFDIDSAGVYRVRYSDLLAQGIDLRGMPLHKLAVTRNGEPIARQVTNQYIRYNRRFGPGSVLMFYAEGPSASHARYIASQPYKLTLDASKVIEFSKLPKGSDAGLLDDSSIDASASSHVYRQDFGEKNLYSFGLGGDGWYDSSIRAIRSIGTKSISWTVAADANLDQPANIDLTLYGVTNFPRIDADGDGKLEPSHHYRVYLNRDQFPDAIVDDYANGKDYISVSQQVVGQLKHGENELQIELIPDNGHGLDLAYFVDGSVSYSRPNTMTSKGLRIAAPLNKASLKVDTNGLNVSSIVAVDGDGNTALHSYSLQEDSLALSLSSSDSQRGPIRLFFQAEESYAQPSSIYLAEPVDQTLLDLSETDYVVIADDSLRGETLQRFVNRQFELGRRTKVVSSQSIFDAYSDGSPVPHAIADYLAEQERTSPFKYVLLVGGHTYNYHGYNTDESNRPINLIPSFYRGSEAVIRQIPTAVPFVDFDQDGAPDRAIGRWPVRDQDQLKLIVDKTLAWHADGSHKDSLSALFIADAKDQQNNFSQSTRRLMSSLGSQLSPWLEPQEVLLDDILSDNSIPTSDKLGHARTSIVDAINQGPALTVYSGHGAPGVWGRQALVYGPVSDQLVNAEEPTLIVPLACYTTYYEAPDVKSLPEVLLTDSSGGAVAITGAALLSRAGDNERFGRALLKKLSVSGMDLGSAVLSIKQEMHKVSPRHQTVVDNWLTLGDPTLSFGLPSTETTVVEDENSLQEKILSNQ